MKHTMFSVAWIGLGLLGCHHNSADDPHHAAQPQQSMQCAEPQSRPTQLGTAQPSATPPAAAQSNPVAQQSPADMGRLLTSTGIAPKVEWTAEEQQKDIAIRELSRSASASVHLVRARGAEKPHTHDEHDLIVMLVSGSVRAHLGDQVLDAHPGDVIQIPRGLPHWVENTGSEPSLSFAIFSPPFDGKDRHFIGQ
jgi:quercetin dioxygenase-like cupin family protein